MVAADRLRAYDGAIAVITGGASGIGAALAKALARRGCHVVLGDINEEGARAVAAEIVAAGGTGEGMGLDVRDAAAFRELLGRCHRRQGRLDYLFNNAGIGIIGSALELGLDDWNRSIDVNLRGVVHGSDAAYRIMAKQGFGHIINTASIAGLMQPWPGMAAYSMTKHGIVAMTTALRLEAEPHGVRFTALCPGVIRTPLLQGVGGQTPDVHGARLRRHMERARPTDAGAFAERVVDQLRKNPAIIVDPLQYRGAWWLARTWPSLAAFVAKRAMTMG